MRAYHEFDPSKPVLGTLASCEIVVDRPRSHNHLLDEMDPQEAGTLLETVLHTIDSQGQDYLVEEVPCQGAALYTPRVTTSEEDEVVYAYRKDRKGQTRFVLDREPETTDRVTVVLKRDSRRQGLMVLVATLIGPKPEPEPWDPNLRDEASREASREFWSRHALIWSPEAIDWRKNFGRRPETPEFADLARR